MHADKIETTKINNTDILIRIGVLLWIGILLVMDEVEEIGIYVTEYENMKWVNVDMKNQLKN